MTSRKKWAIGLASFALIVIAFYTYTHINQINTKESVSIILDPSPDFSEEELEKGAEKVLSSFNAMWKDSTLYEIHFDNELYQSEMANRVPDTSRFSNLKKENVLIFTTKFKTGNKVEGSIGPNSPIEGWQFILSRSSKKGAWHFLDQGV